MIIYGFHGVLSEETTLGQRFEIDLEISFKREAHQDEISQTICYASVHQVIERIVKEERFKLLETLGEVILEAIQKKFPILTARIQIRKPSVPIQAVLECVEVELTWPFS